MLSTEQILSWFERNRERILAEWFEFLRFASVSADPARADDCRACAAWLAGYIESLGFDTEPLAPSELPVVLGERLTPPGRPTPTVLFYGHYDVQPAGRPEEWETPPFEPVLRNGRVYARGASDNKGQTFAFLQAVTCLRAHRQPLPALRLLVEGQEECGSPLLTSRMEEWRRRLGADVLLVNDTHRDPSGRPAITMGLRGMVHLTVECRGPANDLHSGVHGGIAPNPAQGLAAALASLHHPDGSIAVPGFLDRIRAPTQREGERAAGEAFDPAAYQRDTGVAPLGGERDRPVFERRGFRPTIEINGLHSGYAGPGIKTIIPATATARISCRLCPDQSPRACLDALEAHLLHQTPPGLKMCATERVIGGRALRLPLDAEPCRLAAAVLRDIDPRGPVHRWEGASIPVLSLLRDVSGAAPVLVGFSDEADRIHAPGESYGIDQFTLGLRFGVQMLQALAAPR